MKYFRERGMMPSSAENKDDSILSLRKILQISNLVNLNEIISLGEHSDVRKLIGK